MLQGESFGKARGSSTSKALGNQQSQARKKAEALGTQSLSASACECCVAHTHPSQTAGALPHTRARGDLEQRVREQECSKRARKPFLARLESII